MRIVERIDDSQLATLTGNTHPMARAQYDRGRVSPDLPMTDLVLVLKRSPEQQADFDKFVATLYDPASENYHQWLTPRQIGEEYGPAESDVAAISSWLRGHGFSIDEVATDRMTIRFGGTAAQVEQAFHTEIHSLDVKGAQHIANMSDPRIPSALTPVVLGVKALHSFQPRPLHRLGSQVKFNREKGKWERIAGASAAVPGSGAKGELAPVRPLFGINVPASNGNSAYLEEDVAPYDFAMMYNVLPAWNAGIDGTGQTIAVAGTSDISTSDLATFRSSFGLPPISSFTTVVANGSDPGQCGVTPTVTCTLDDQIENSLDVEWSSAVAKGAKIVLVVSGANSATTDTIYASSNYVIQNRTAPILNVSYGLCELAEGTTGNAAYNNLWQSAYAAGIAVFVAAGDSGSATCDAGGDQGGNNVPYAAEYGLTVSGLASTPYDTAVGGTDLNWGTTASPYWSSTNDSTTGASALGYIPEVPWNDTCVNPLVLSYLQQAAQAEGASTPSDAESACNFVFNWYQYVYQDFGVDLASLVDTVGGGGGVSACTTGDGQNVSSCSGGYAKPSWQAGVTGIPSDGKRDLPDVSFFASNGFLSSAYLMCVSAAGSCTYSDSTENSAQEIGGTSASSPAMAGVMALINQKAGAPQGSPNTELYALAAKQTYANCSAEKVTDSDSCYFNDIDSGSNSEACDYTSKSPNCSILYSGDPVGILPGYNAVAGYDQATGLGSLNVANIVNAWPIANIPVVSLSPGTLSFPGTFQGTSSAGIAITLKNTGRAALTLNGTGQGITITGTNASAFSQKNNCGASVAAGSSCTITVTFSPPVTGPNPYAATLNIADNVFGSPQTVALSGLGTAPVLNGPLTYTFNSTAIGTSATPAQIKLYNNGDATLTFSGFSLTGADASSFSETNNCGTTLAAGSSCTVTANFKPLAAGTLTAKIDIGNNGYNSQSAFIGLVGVGTGPAVSLGATSLGFPSTALGGSASSQVKLTNTGSAALSLSGTGLGISIAGAGASSFSQSNNCGASVAAGKFCTIMVTFKPAAIGNLKAAIQIHDNAAGSPQAISLSGTGLGALASLSHNSLTFASTEVGFAAFTQTVTLSNKGNATLSLYGTGLGIALLGTGASSFAQTNNCGTQVAAGKSCTIKVTFKPLKTGTLTAAVSIGDNAAGSPQKVALTGTGTGAIVSLSHSGLLFPTTAIGKTAAAQTFTLTNKGNAALSLSGTGLGVSITGANPGSFSQTDNCGTSVAAGANCTFTVTFAPKRTGTLTATVTLHDNTATSPQNVTLKGTGK